MTEEQKETEELIFEAACRVFKRKGYAGARMQEIADEADINKSMLHYYYRSKEKLFEKVYQEEMSRFFPVIMEVINSDLPLNEKIKDLVDAYYSFFSKNPKIVQFVILEMNQNPERFKKFIQKQGLHHPPKFFQQVATEIDQANMDPVRPEQLMVSIVALTQHPFIAKPLVQGLFEMDEGQYQQFLEERKAFLVDFILNGINYKKR